MNARDYFMKNVGFNDNINQFQKQEMDYIKNKYIIDKFKNKDDTSKDKDDKFFNMTINDIYHKLINIIPNLYNDYYKHYLDSSINLRYKDKDVKDNVIMRDAILNTIMNSKNIIYLGIWIILISLLLYILDI